MTTMNIGLFSELVNQKADLDLRNVDVSKTDIVIEYQEPDASNNYTWYRLYASGWVEQGGVITGSSSGWVTVNLPITMVDTKYTITESAEDADEDVRIHITGYTHKTVNSFKTVNCYTSFLEYEISWVVSGKADMTGHEVLPSKKEKDENDHRVIAFQKPSAENNYTWYRKYADGWVEQGGRFDNGSKVRDKYNISITFPITMKDTSYTILASAGKNDNNSGHRCATTDIYQVTTTGAKLGWYGLGDNDTLQYISWQVSGMYAEQ